MKVRNMIIIIVCLITSCYLQAQGLKILYIGDSITDGNWGGGNAAPSSKRNLSDMNHIHGHGFMYLCAAYYMGKFPDQEFQFFNRGISGNTLNDLEKRWQMDVLDIKPDVLSILVGINDVNKYLREKDPADFDFKGWEEKYRKLLDKSLSENPKLKIVLASPFVFRIGRMKKNSQYDDCEQMVLKLVSIVQKIALDYNAIYLPYQNMFDHLMKKYSTLDGSYWIWDGVHPTTAGHQRMAEMWIEKSNECKLLF